MNIPTAERCIRNEMEVTIGNTNTSKDRYVAKRVLLASGSRDKLKRDQYYAFEKHKRGLKSVWSITFASLHISSLPVDMEAHPLHSHLKLCDDELALTLFPSVHIQNNPIGYASYLDFVDTWCIQNKDVPLCIIDQVVGNLEV